MKKFKQLLRRHWGKAGALAVVLVGGITLAASAGLRESAHREWHRALAWAGLTGTEGGSDTTFWCPMHPQIKSTKPNSLCPVCNMALVKLEATPKDLSLMPQQVQQTGVATEPVKRRNLYRAIDTTGRFDYDETRRVGISSWVTGKSRIEKLHVNFTGQRVKQGQLMAEVYSPELITAQEEFLVALKSDDRSRGTRNGNNRLNASNFNIDLVKSSRQKLLYLGMKSHQIDALEKSRKMVEFVPILAPVSGTVIERHVQKGQ
ncbi:MAG: efflux RND transporter periplasmic adaptor subunit, partial [Planctomycetaceae bacterium]